jgi:cholesterol oxidase
MMTEPAPTGGTSVSFTEQMKGFVTRTGGGDPRTAYEKARERHEAFMFELTVTAPDIDVFADDPTHAGIATGFVDGAVVGGRREVVQGWVNLFVGPAASRSQRMLYRLWTRTIDDEPVTVVGFKEVHDDPGFDIWADTTTLYVQLLAGHVPPGDATSETGHLDADDDRVVGAGILRIEMLDFAKQMTTFRTEGPGGLAAIARFGSLFFGEVWSTYAPGADKTPESETP